MIRCTCCQAEITMPQFHNGNPYGYTCIKKVDPAQKRKKVEFIPCDSFKVLQGEGTQRLVIKIVINGAAKNVPCYVDINNGRWSLGYVQEGVLYIPKP